MKHQCPACHSTYSVVDLFPVSVKRFDLYQGDMEERPEGEYVLASDVHAPGAETCQNITSETTQMAMELSAEVDNLREQLDKWRNALLEMSADLSPRQQLKVACMVEGLRGRDQGRLLDVFEAIRGGAAPRTFKGRPGLAEDFEDEP